jgi:dethiobiotin synthetase
MNTNSVFVTGTDTGVGKTYISCRMIRERVAAGLRVAAMKPIAAGLIDYEGQRVSEDVIALEQASNVKAPRSLINPFAFTEAIAPHIASDLEGNPIDLAVIQSAFQQLQAVSDCVVVEGAGGFLVPLDAQRTLADLAVALQLPVVLVVGMRLGCLNHALLTAEAIAARDLSLAGWIANECAGVMPRFDENLATLKTKIRAPCLEVVRYAPYPLTSL